MINWNKPIVAVGKNGKTIKVSVNDKYHKLSDATPVKFPVNIWTNNAQGGTWYFNDEGLATSGITPDGYDALYILRNL